MRDLALMASEAAQVFLEEWPASAREDWPVPVLQGRVRWLRVAAFNPAGACLSPGAPLDERTRRAARLVTDGRRRPALTLLGFLAFMPAGALAVPVSGVIPVYAGGEGDEQGKIVLILPDGAAVDRRVCVPLSVLTMPGVSPYLTRTPLMSVVAAVPALGAADVRRGLRRVFEGVEVTVTGLATFGLSRGARMVAGEVRFVPDRNETLVRVGRQVLAVARPGLFDAEWTLDRLALAWVHDTLRTEGLPLAEQAALRWPAALVTAAPPRPARRGWWR